MNPSRTAAAIAYLSIFMPTFVRADCVPNASNGFDCTPDFRVALSGDELETGRTFQQFQPPALLDDDTVAFISLTDSGAFLYEGYFWDKATATLLPAFERGAMNEGDFQGIRLSTLDRYPSMAVSESKYIVGPADFYDEFGSTNLFIASAGTDGIPIFGEPGDLDLDRVMSIGGDTLVLTNAEGLIAARTEIFEANRTTRVGESILLPGQNEGMIALAGEPSPLAGTNWAGFFQPVAYHNLALNDLGRVAFSAVLTNESGSSVVTADTDEVLVRQNASALSVLAREGDLAEIDTPNVVLGSRSVGPTFNHVSLNDSGDVGSMVRLRTGVAQDDFLTGGFQGGDDYDAIARVSGDTDGFEFIAVRGQSPDSIGFDRERLDGNLRISRLGVPEMNDAGDIAFFANLGTFANDTNDGLGLFLYEAGSKSYKRIFQTSGATFAEIIAKSDSVAGQSFSFTDGFFNDLALNNSGDLVFTANTIADEFSPTRKGLFLYKDGELKLIAQVGSTIEIQTGDVRTVAAIEFLSGSSTSGRPSGLNDAGSLAYGLFFEDGSRGVFLDSFLIDPVFDFLWSGDCGSSSWFDPCGSTNWDERLSGKDATRFPGTESDDRVFIIDASVLVDEREVSLDFINATGSLKINQNFELLNPSSIENLDLNANLATANELTLTGFENFWRSGTISGGGEIKIRGSQSGEDFEALILDTGGQIIGLENTLSIDKDSQFILRSATLDLMSIGKIENRSGVFNTIVLESGTIIDSGDQPSIINLNTLEKRTSGSVTLDAFLESKAEGAIKVFEGTLIIDDPAIIESNITIAEGATLEFGQALQTLGDLDGNDFSISGTGRLVKRAGTFLLSGGGTTYIDLVGSQSVLEVGGDVDLDAQNDALNISGNFEKTGSGNSTIKSKNINFTPSGTSNQISVQSGGLTIDGFITLGENELSIESGSLTFQSSEDRFPTIDEDVISLGTGYSINSGTLNLNANGVYEASNFTFSGGSIALGTDHTHSFNKSIFTIKNGAVSQINSGSPQSELEDAPVRFANHNFAIEDGKLEFLTTTEIKDSTTTITSSGSVEQKGDIRSEGRLTFFGDGAYRILSGSLVRKAFPDGDRLVTIRNSLEGEGFILDGGSIDGSTQFSESETYLRSSEPRMVLDNLGTVRLRTGSTKNIYIKNGFKSIFSEVDPGLILASEPGMKEGSNFLNSSGTANVNTDSSSIAKLIIGGPPLGGSELPPSFLQVDITNSEESVIEQVGPFQIDGDFLDDTTALSIYNDGLIEFNDEILEDSIFAGWTLQNNKDGQVLFTGTFSIAPTLFLSNEGKTEFQLDGEVETGISNRGRMEISGSVDFTQSSFAPTAIINTGEFVFKSGTSSIENKFKNLSTVTVETGATVEINNFDDEFPPFPTLLSPNNWNINGGVVRLSLGPNSEPPDIQSIDARLSMVGAASSLNNLPNPLGPFSVLNSGRLTLGDIAFTVTGNTPIFGLDDSSYLTLLPGAILSASEIDQDNEAVIIQYAGSEIDAQSGSFFGEHRIVGDVFGSSERMSSDAILPLSSENKISPQLESNTATITGNYTMGATSKLVFDVGGTELGSGYSQLIVGGNATLNGTLILTRNQDFPLIETFTVEVLQAASISGNFSNVMVSDPSGRRQYEATVSETGLSVSSSTLSVATFEEWRQAIFTEEELADNLISGADADNDNDSLSVFEEYLHDGHPKRNDLPPLDVEFDHDTEGASTTITIKFPWADDMADYGYQVQISTNLIDWEPLETTLVSSEDRGPNSLIKLTAEQAIEDPNGKIYVRLKAVVL